MVNEQRLVDLFVRLVEIDSETGNEAKFKDYLIEEFAARGIKAIEDETASIVGGNAGNLLVRIPGTVAAKPLLFSAHMDTVSPGVGIKAVVEAEIIKSRGNTILGSDDKAAIAALLEAYDVLKENNIAHPPLEFLFTVGEEQGLNGAKAFDYSVLESEIGYVLDAGGLPGTIIIKSPAQNEIDYQVYGKAAHAGINPEDGANAIKLAALAISQMPSGRIDAETTCNFGLIKGGKAQNIVADYCEIKGEARSLNREKLDNITKELVDTFNEIVKNGGGKPEVEVTFLYPEISLDSDDEVVQLAVKAVESIGLEPFITSTGGGSDASIINGKGIPCVNLGIGMQKVHTNEEFILVKDLVDDVRLVLGIIEQFVELNS